MEEKLMLALLMVSAIGMVAGYLGTLMLSKRMSLVGGPLGHMTMPGITLALLLGFDVSIGAFGMLLLAISLIWGLERWTRLPLETLTAVVFSSSVAVAFLFLPHEEVEVALIGDISQITWVTTGASVILSLVAWGLARMVYKKMVFMALSEDLARSEGVKVERINLVYLLAVAIVIGLGIRVVGSLLTAAIVAIPAATSKNLSKNMTQYAWGGALAGGVAGVVGIGLSQLWAIPAGPAVIISSAGIFLVSVAVKRA